MAALEIGLRAYLVLLCVGLVLHYFIMADKAKRTPVGIKPAYIITSCCGFAGFVLALTPGSAALLASLVAVSVAAGGALVVALRAWSEGVHMCEVMDSAAAMAAAHKVREVVGKAQRDAHVLGTRMTVRSWEQVANMEQDPRDRRRP